MRIKVTLLFVFLFTTNILRAEGTKELSPLAANLCALQINGLNIPLFARYVGIPNPDYTLNITVSNPGELINVGFRRAAGPAIYYRIKNSAGVIVVAAVPIPLVGAGSITTHAQAVIGPNTLIGGAGGYVPQVYSLTPGDYSIEFNSTSPTIFNATAITFTLFDITVSNLGNKINGRVWSKSWALTMASFIAPVDATMFMYSDNGIVASIDFNGMQPFGFGVACNQYGIQNTGAPLIDRKSKVGNLILSQYKIFVNDPDPAVFPTGTIGGLVGVPYFTGNMGNYCLNITVALAQSVEISIDINGIPGFQSGTTDLLLISLLNAGTNCIPWNGLDGLGNPVIPGASYPVLFDLSETQFHLPLFDIENNLNGFIINAIRPALPTPEVFWDDSQIVPPLNIIDALDGVSNLTGCNGALGCHQWANRGNGGCVPGCPETVNTWWNVNRINTILTLPGFAIVDANASTIGFGFVNNDYSACNNASPISLNGSISNLIGGSFQWFTPGDGTFLPNNGVLNPIYIPGTADQLAGNVKFGLFTIGGSSPLVSDSVLISLLTPPIVSAGNDTAVCSTIDSISLLSSTKNAAALSIVWSGGGNVFNPSTVVLSSYYFPTPIDSALGSVTLQLVGIGNIYCPNDTAIKTITFIPPPTISPGTDTIICNTFPTINLFGATLNGINPLWSTSGTGNFTTPGALNTTYNRSPNDSSQAFIYLRLSANNTSCPSVTDSLRLGFSITTIDAGKDTVACSNDTSIKLNAVNGGYNSVIWTSVGSGTFFNSTNYTPNYSFSALDLTMPSIKLVFTANTSCGIFNDSLQIQINMAPIAFAGPDLTVGGANQSILLDGTSTSVGIQYSYLWTTLNDEVEIISPTLLKSDGIIRSLPSTAILNVTNNGNGCSNRDTLTVLEIDVEVPNAFSPNKDGTNDFFKIKNIDNYPNAVIKIFDQWSNLIFTGDPAGSSLWDGTANGKINPSATYYYLLDLKVAGKREIKGYITILR